MWAMTFSQPGDESLGRRAWEGGTVTTGKRGTDRGSKEYPGLPAEQKRQRRKEGASTGRYEEIGLILVLPSSCGPELAAPRPSAAAAAPGAGSAGPAAASAPPKEALIPPTGVAACTDDSHVNLKPINKPRGHYQELEA